MQIIDIFPDFGKSWGLLKIYRDEKGTKIREPINNFIDYFYCAESRLTEIINDINISQQIINWEKCNIPAFQCNEQIYKIYLKGIWSKYKVRKFLNNNFEKIFELDVDSPMRYTIDNIKEIKKTNYRTLFFDIETTTDNGFPDWRNPLEKITCITLYDNYVKKYIILTLKPNENIEDKRKLSEDKIIYFFSDEKKLINEFIDIVEKQDYDILTAWNISFDLTYIFGRSDKLGIDKTKLSPVGNVEIKTQMNKQQREDIVVSIRGRFVIDLLLRYKGIIFKEIPTYSLDYVSELELGVKDKKLKILDFSNEWKNHLDRFIEYSIKDVEILVLLDKKLNLLNYLEELRLINYLPNIYYASTAKNLIDMAILREYKDKLLLPTKLNKERVKLGGGYIKEPKTEIYENVAVFDFSGMYPSIIQTFNLSKDTIVPIEKADFITTENDINEEELERRGFKTGWTLKHKGIIPTILDKILETRKNIKEEMKNFNKESIEYRERNLRQYALKAPINANYGVNAYPGFRLYEPRVASTTTYLGRQLNQYCIKRIEEDFNFKVLYADTDSFFVKIDKKDDEIIKKLEEKINKIYVKEFVHSYSSKITNITIKVEYEKFFNKLFLVKKRRYLGQLDNKEWIYKGVDLKRSNTPEIIKEILQYYITEIFNYNELNNILKICVKKLKEEKQIDKFKIPLKLSKEYTTNLPQKRAADWANKNLKSNFSQGNKFYGVWVKNHETDIIGFMDTNEIIERTDFQIDYEKYKLILQQKIENISLEEINFDFEQLKLLQYF